MKKKILVASYVTGEDGAGGPAATYQDAVYAAGGLGFLSGPVLTEEEAAELVPLFDGLVLAGGGDINAEFLVEAPHPKAHYSPRERDITEFNLASAFLSAGKPILAICRGEQVLNVALGGTHDQHIFDRPEVAIRHADPATRHEVTILPGTLLSSVFPGEEKLTVNSTHHQAVKELAPGLTLNALSPDGVIEGYQFNEQALAVQFHPERLPDEIRLPIFRWLIEHA